MISGVGRAPINGLCLATAALSRLFLLRANRSSESVHLSLQTLKRHHCVRLPASKLYPVVRAVDPFSASQGR